MIFTANSRYPRAAALFAAAALVTGGIAPASGADPDTAPPPAAEAPKAKQDVAPKKERIYCVNTELTGSRMTEKICKTRKQWMQTDGFDPLEKNQ